MADTTRSSGPRVFVYGTLKKGHPNGHYLDDAEYLGRHALVGAFRMLDLGHFPAVAPTGTKDEQHIWGEVYAVDDDTLDAIDCLEGHPKYYKREQIDTPWKKAWCYFFPQAWASESSAKTIDAGVWDPCQDERDYIACASAAEGCDDPQSAAQ